jgi:hypothetical protein
MERNEFAFIVFSYTVHANALRLSAIAMLRQQPF